MRAGIRTHVTPRRPALVPKWSIAAGLLLAALSLAAPEASAQFFGQNKVHYKNFRWKVLRTQHFDIHYYQGTEAAVQDAALMAERSYLRLSRVLNHQIRPRVPLVLYASHTDFEQTNITPELLGIGTGGVTEFLKRRVFLPFTGSYAELDHVLTHELVHAFQVDILFGDSQSLIGNPFAAQIPLWFMEGMAEYLSAGPVDPNTAMWLRDASLEGYLIPIRILGYVGDIRVYRFGQSIFQFIADKYGVAKIGELLKRTRRLGSAERALEATTGLTVDVLSKKWTESVRKEYLPQIVDHQSPNAVANRITDAENDLSNFNVAASVSPSGLRCVYISDRSMYNDVYLASALDGKVEKKLISGERTGTFETLRFFNTSIAWSPDESEIAIPAKAGGEDALYLLKIPSGKIEKKYRFGLDAIYSPTWSPDGNRIAFVGLKGGRSSLYLMGKDGKGLKTLLEGRYAYRDPTWSPDGTRIAYSTDEGEGTDEKRLIFGPLKIAVLDVQTGRITIPPGQQGKNISPQWTPDGQSILFVSDRTGISNIYRLDLPTGETQRLTDLLTGVSGLVPEAPCLSLSRDGKRLLFTAFTRGAWDVWSVREPMKFIQSPPAFETEPKLVATSLAPLGTSVASTAPSTTLEPSEPLPSEGPTSESPTSEAPSSSETPPSETPPAESPTSETPPSETPPSATPPAESPTSEAPSSSETPPSETPSSDASHTGAAGSTQIQIVPHDTAAGDSTGAPAPDFTAAPPSHGAVPPFAAPTDSTAALAESDTTLAEYVMAAYAEPLADSTTFQHLPYKASFSRDYFSGGAVVASNVGFAGSSVISFSDLLGNHNIIAILNLYGNLGESDVYIAYSNLARRVNYGFAVFQYQKDLLLFSSPQNDDLQNEIHRGGAFFFSRPFNRFRRVEFGVQTAVVDQRIYRYDRFQGSVQELSDDGNYFYVAPNIGLIADNTMYGNTGPINGGRSRYTVEHAFGGVSYTTTVFDWRRYTNVSHSFTFAQRLLGGASFGQDPQFFRFGGPFTYRGVDYGDLVGTRAVIGTLEFRFPLIESLRTGFPFTLSLGGVNGVVFFDAASAWTADYEPVFLSRVNGLHTQDLRLAFGFGARINLGYFIARYDYGREHYIEGGLGPPHHFFAFGPEF
jgi:Tol biopolymer transport system component